MRPGGTAAGARWAFQHGAHLSVLWALAVVQPTVEVLSASTDFFVMRKTSGWPFVVALVIFTFIPPAALLATEAAVGRASTRWRRRLHLLLIGILTGLVGIYALKLALRGQAWTLVFVGGAVIGVLGAVLYTQVQAVRSALTVLAPVPAVVLLIFIFFSPAEGLLFGGKGSAAASFTAGKPPPVVFVIFDELPISSLMDGRGQIDAARYPAFGRLARESTWYRNTTAAGDQTDEAVPAILTGERSVLGKASVLSNHPKNLFTLLAGRYRVQAMEHATWLCPAHTCPNEVPVVRRVISVASAMSLLYAHVMAPPRIGEKLPAIGRTWGEALAAEDPAHAPSEDAGDAELSRFGDVQFERFLGSLDGLGDRRERPQLSFLHSSLPHIPWNYLPSGKVYDAIRAELPGLSKSFATWAPHPGLVKQGFQRHLLQAKFTDRLLGRLLERLRQVGAYDRALIVVVADHGVSFRSGGERRAVNRVNAGDVGLVPFFVRKPGQRRGRVIDRHLQTIDVLPTMVDALGSSIPGRMDGRAASRLPPFGRRTAVVTRHQGGRVRISTATLERARRATVARQVRLFGVGPRWSDLFGVGSGRALIGRRMEDIPSGLPARASAELDEPERFQRLDLSSRYLPALINGRLEGPGARGIRELAVALNGRIAGLGPSFSDGGELRFSVIAAPRLLRQGRNSVQLLAVHGRGSSTRVSPLRRSR